METDNTGKTLSYYVQMRERFFLKVDIRYGWNFWKSRMEESGRSEKRE